MRHKIMSAGLVALGLACSSTAVTTPSGPTLAVTASSSSVVANGTNTVTIHVDGSTAGNITVATTTAGTLSATTFTATPFDVTLTTCDATSDTSCAGIGKVSAIDGAGVAGFVNVTFTQAQTQSNDDADAGSDAGSGGGDAGSGAPVTHGTTTLGSIGPAAAGTSGGTSADGGPSGSGNATPVLGVLSSGYNETALVSFQVNDALGYPYAAGLTVTFTHTRLAGSFIGETTANCRTSAPFTCTTTGVTDDNGVVSVILHSGQAAGVVSIMATATAGGVTSTFTQGNLAIIGAKASGAHITMDCSPRNIPALTRNDCSYSHYAADDSTITCAASFADRFNNVLGISTQVVFASEAGSVGPPSATPQYDPSTAASDQTALGTAASFINVTGGVLPVDVDPFVGGGDTPPDTGEYSLTYLDSCGPTARTHNPRDGLVTVIAMVSGEEGFVDLNGNGAYDSGEPFIDMGEPYIDANDNGMWEQGETYYDVNQNGSYDGPNGVWDANTIIWTETRVLYTDYAASGLSFSRFYAVGGPPQPPSTTALPNFTTDNPPGPYTGVLGTTSGPNGIATSVFPGVYFIDPNFNRLAPATDFAISPLGDGVTAEFVIDPINLDSLGMTFTQQYCNDPASPTTCSNVCATAPCYVVTNVGDCAISGNVHTGCTGFFYGTKAAAIITGACTAKGITNVNATATLNSVISSFSVPVLCTP
jgi:hypothetical protein